MRKSERQTLVNLVLKTILYNMKNTSQRLNHYSASSNFLHDQRAFFDPINRIKQLDAVYHDGEIWRKADKKNPPTGLVADMLAVHDTGYSQAQYEIISVCISGLAPSRPPLTQTGHEQETWETYAKMDYGHQIINNTKYFWDYTLNKTTPNPNPTTSYYLGRGYSGKQLNVSGWAYTYEGIIMLSSDPVVNNSSQVNIYNGGSTSSVTSNYKDDSWHFDEARQEMYYGFNGKARLFNKEVYMFATSGNFPQLGQTDVMYIDDSNQLAYYWNGSEYRPLDTDTDHLRDQKIPWAIIGQKCTYSFPFAWDYRATNVQNLGDAELTSYTLPITVSVHIYSDINGQTIILPNIVLTTISDVKTYLQTHTAGNWASAGSLIFTVGNPNVAQTSFVLGTDSLGQTVEVKTTDIRQAVSILTKSRITEIVTSAGIFGPSPLFNTDIEARDWLNTLGIGAFQYTAGVMTTQLNPNTITSVSYQPDTTNTLVTSSTITGPTLCQAITTDAYERGRAIRDTCTSWEPGNYFAEPYGVYNGNKEVITHGHMDDVLISTGGFLPPSSTIYADPTTGKLTTTPSPYIVGHTGCAGQLDVDYRYLARRDDTLGVDKAGEVFISVEPCDMAKPIAVSDNDPRLFTPYVQLMDTEWWGPNPNQDLHDPTSWEIFVNFNYGYTNISDSTNGGLDCSEKNSIYYWFDKKLEDVLVKNSAGTKYSKMVCPKTGLYDIKWQGRLLIPASSTVPYWISRWRVVVQPLASALYYTTIGDKKQYIHDNFLNDISVPWWTAPAKNTQWATDIFLWSSWLWWLYEWDEVQLSVDLSYVSDTYYST
jgi:hypothetical protein